MKIGKNEKKQLKLVEDWNAYMLGLRGLYRAYCCHNAYRDIGVLFAGKSAGGLI